MATIRRTSVRGLLAALVVCTGVLGACSVKLPSAGYYQQAKGMDPTIRKGDSFVTDESPGELRRGQIILFANPGRAEGETDIKRIVGIAGDTVSAVDGVLVVNGEPVEEPYVVNAHESLTIPATFVHPGHLYVLGDNRDDSRDSRYYGAIDDRTVIGIVTKVTRPASSAKTFDENGRAG